jgi:serine/threonine protein kinase/pimeloyl-ACP methyl ester carboxylesterase
MPSVVLGERYELRDRIGSGGMATVWLGFDTVLGREVAIKVFSRTLATHERFRHRFDREGRHITALKHPNIVIAYDFNLDGEDLFIVMELVEGTSVRQLLDQSRQLPSASVTDLAIDVLAGLGHAHGAGILHDDIKPSNIIVAESGTAKLADFGIIEPAEELFDHADRRTILGVPSYSSPELLTGKPLQPPSDLYSVACVLYECVAGHLPFMADDVADLISCQQSTTPESLQRVAPTAPIQLCDTIMRALEKDPTSRFQSAVEMTQALLTSSAARVSRPDRFPERAIPESRTVTVTVVFCDVVGSTALQSAIGDDAADDIRRKLFGVLRSAIERNNGNTVKTLGDGVMAVFSESTVDAVRCAIEMTEAAPGVAENLSVRVGVSHGEVTSEEGDWFGTPVVEAARLESAAAPGTVLAAEVVRTTVGSRGGFHFDERHPLHLKGLPGPLEASRVRKSDSSPISTEGSASKTDRAHRDLKLRNILRVQSRRRGIRVLGVLALVILVGSLATLVFDGGVHPNQSSASVTQTDVGYVPKYEPTSCPAGMGGAGVTCGDLIVPQDRSHPKGRQVRMLVVRAQAETPNPSPDPVLYLSGLGGLVGAVSSTTRLYANYIGLTMRGSPGSVPDLNCPEEGAAEVAALALPTLSSKAMAEQVSALGACRARLVAAGIDPNDYGADAMAADVRDLLRVLHIKQVNITAEATPTELVALDVMRHYPQIVRSAALEDPSPPDLDNDFFDVADVSADLQRYAALCAANPSCHSAYPDIVGQWLRDYEQFQQHPVTENVSLQSGTAPVPVLVDGQSLAIALGTALEGVGALPTIAAEIYAPTPAVAVTGIVYGVPDDAAWTTSTYCKDMLPAASPASQLENQDDTVDFPQYAGLDVFAQIDPSICAAWNVQPDDASDFTPLVSSIPTFLFTGALDPWLSPSWIGQMGEDLTHAVTLIFPTLTQGSVETQSAPSCLTNLEREFFDHPTAHLNVSECEAQSPPIAFAGT